MLFFMNIVSDIFTLYPADLWPSRFSTYLRVAFVSSSSCLSLLTYSMTHEHTVTVEMSLAASFIYLGAGLSVGLAGLAAGFAIGIVGDAGVRGTAQQPRLYVGMVSLFIHTSSVILDRLADESLRCRS